MAWIEKSLHILKTRRALILHRYQRLYLFGKVFVWLLIMFYASMGAAIIVITPSRIAQYLYDRAHQISLYPFGWLLLAGSILIISFPPFIGHTTTVTLCGFAYGMKGFFIASSASLIGSSFVFFVLRLLFSQRIRRWSAKNDKWLALESVVRTKGLPLIILIRISPFPPWVYSNTLFASIESVSLWQFAVATVFVFPKLLLHVFIGSRIAALSDGDQRGRMDTQAKVINGLLIGGGIVVAIFTSWLVYSLVQKHIRELEGVPPAIDELAAEAIEDFDEEAPLLRNLSQS